MDQMENERENQTHYENYLKKKNVPTKVNKCMYK